MLTRLARWWARYRLRRLIRQAATKRRREAKQARARLRDINKARFSGEFWSDLNRTKERTQ